MEGFGLRIRFAQTDDVRLAARAPAHWRQKAAEERFPKDRNQELVAGGLLAEMLSEVCPVKSDIVIDMDANGKPAFRDFPKVHFSLSHTDGLVMCVIADRPVGCDVERIVPLDEDVRKEIGSVEAWTKREAKFKCGRAAGEPRAVSAPEGYCAAISEGGL